MAEAKGIDTDGPKAAEAIRQRGQASGRLLVDLDPELRASLHGMIGMTELALETDLSPRQRRYLNGIRVSAETLLSTINNLLSVAKIEAGTFDLDPIAFNLRDSLGYTMGTLALRAREKGMELVCRVRGDVPDALVGDPTLLRHIVANLIEHAMGRSGRGVVILRVETEWDTGDAVHLEFSVTRMQNRKLTQPGAAGAKAPEEAGPAANGKPASLLTMTSRLIEAMGGQMWVDRAESRDEATRFSARFGLRKTPVPRPAPVEAAAVRGLPVFVVDDSEVSRGILEETLATWGMVPVLAESSASALAALEQAQRSGTPFGLVLLDAGMPGMGMDGFALAQRIRQNPALSATRLVMLTSSGQRGDAARCRRLGIAAYLSRPVKQSELFDAIVTVLGTPAGEPQPVLVTRHSLRESRRILRILLLDERLIDQTLAMRLLERRGHMVLTAGSVQEALDVLEQQPIDVVLIDLQWSGRDGYRMAEAIRERTHGTSPLIVAMAHRWTEAERERWREGGVERCLDKPFQARALIHAVEVLDLPPDIIGKGTLAQRPADEPINRAEMLTRVDGDPELLAEVAALVLHECPRLLTEIKAALGRRDLLAFERAAQALHASLRTVSAKAACESVLTLEAAGRAGDLAGAEAARTSAEQELARLKPYLESLGAPHVSSSERSLA